MPTTQTFAVDVNNDGISDLVYLTSPTNTIGGEFSVNINNGDGTFKPPVVYPTGTTALTPLTWGDFNHDGKLDIVAAVPPNQIALWLGNGDGTFQAPITITPDFPAGTTLSSSTIAAADFEHNGNLDLVVSGYIGNDNFSGPWDVFLLHGDGQGHFTEPTVIYQPTSGWLVDTILTGDFDSDNNADVAIAEYLPCAPPATACIGDTSETNVLALFGDGTGSFAPVDVTTIDGAMSLAAADLNNDAATDLYGIQLIPEGSKTQLAVFLGHYGRQFGYLFTPVPSALTNIDSQVVAADFDGTGHWALAALRDTFNDPDTQMVYFLNAGTPNVTIVTGPSPAGVNSYQTGPAVGNFNGDTKPDIAIVSNPAFQSPTSTIVTGINANAQGFYGSCNYPTSGQGIHLCSPTTTTGSPVTFSASANSFGQLRKMELWVDGNKLGEDHLNWGQSSYFNLTGSTLSPGTHDGTIFAADIDNTLQRYDFTFTVQ